MALVPGPTFSAGSGPEVGLAEVHDARGEAQQAAVSVGPVHPGGGGGQTVLLISTGEEVQRSILQVGRLLHKLSVQDQVRSGCRGGSSTVSYAHDQNIIGINTSHRLSTALIK